jgi:tripartite-type tricarboxylate transporter receptor subunit TctC
MKKRIGVGAAIAALVCAVLLVTDALAAEMKYPSRPIDLVSAFNPGDSADIQSRIWGGYLERYLGQPIVPVNKPGGGGVIATTYMANARPDGYTLGNLGDFMVNAILLGQATYKLEDLRIISQVSTIGGVLAVAADATWKTFQDFMDYAKKNPGMKFAHQGIGTIIYMRMENLNKHANLRMIGVPLKGGQEIVTAILGKHVPAGTLSAAVAKPLADAGRLRIIFSFDPPAEVGLDPGIPDFASVFGKGVPDIEAATYLVAPAKTPKDAIEVLERAMEKICRDPGFINELKKHYVRTSFVNGKSVMEEKIPKKTPLIKAIMQESGLIK